MQLGIQDGQVEAWLWRISWHQFYEWYEYSQEEAFGYDYFSFALANTGAAIVNEIRKIAATLGAKNVKTITPMDLIPKLLSASKEHQQKRKKVSMSADEFAQRQRMLLQSRKPVSQG